MSGRQEEGASRPKAELALAFCREVLGWGEDSGIDGHYVCNPGEVYRRFRYTRLDPVFDVVSSWCDEHGLQLYIHKFPGIPYRVRITTFPRPDCVEEAEDLTVALMTACLCAARALRADR